MSDMNEKEKALVADFKWDEDVDEGNEEQPLSDLATNVFACAEKIHQYVVDNMSIEQFAGDDTVEISVPVTLDQLLEDRYDDTYTEDSRLKSFDLLRAAFRLKLDEVGFNTAEKINELMPQQNEAVTRAVREYVEEVADVLDLKPEEVASTTGGISRTIHVTRCDLHDEPSIDVTVTQRAGVPDSVGVGDPVVIKTESTRQCICAEITFESRRN